jgi:uncharacterized protein YndB with AHSA1/START domain
MIDFTVSTEIARTPADVFAYVTDPGKLATWQTNTVSAIKETEGPIGLGTKIREVHSGPFGTKFEELVEVVRYEPGKAFDLHVPEGPPIDAEIRFEEISNGTRMHFRVFGQPTGGMRLLEPVMKPALKRNFTKFCQTLKERLEQGQPL